MGSYTQHLKNKILLSGHKKGYCAICRAYGPLTKEHVPPYKCGNQETVYVNCFADDKKSKFQSQGGLSYRTTCASCNNMWLGQKYDPALIAFFNSIKKYLDLGISNSASHCKLVEFTGEPQKIARSVIGHLLAGNSVDMTTNDAAHAPIYKKMVDYFFDESATLPPELSIYYWFYPCHDVKVFNGIGISTISCETVIGDILKFFPLAFWIVWGKPIGVEPKGFNLLPRRDIPIDGVSKLKIDFNFHPGVFYPEEPIQSTLYTVFTDTKAAVGIKSNRITKS